MNVNPVDDRDSGAALGLAPGEMYRVSYTVGNLLPRRVTRSLATYSGAAHERRWDGTDVVCFTFQRPRGRTLSLLSDQIVDVRPAALNDRGQPVLVEPAVRRGRRPARRHSARSAW